MVTIAYELYTNQGAVLGVVSVTGEDEEDCQRQIEAYLNTKQCCYYLPLEGKTGSLVDLIGLITPSHSAWHEGFRFAVGCDPDGSWWTVGTHGSQVNRYPVHVAHEVLVVIGKYAAADPGWVLR